MANTGPKTVVIIIDNNISNGLYLAKFCKRLRPASEVSWLQVCENDPTAQFEIEDIDHSIVYDLASAAMFIDTKTGESQDIIVFYNPQLGLLQRGVASAVDSQITHTLKKLVQQQRRILVNVHSTEISTRKIAEFIDPSFADDPPRARVISHHQITGASSKTILGVVQETLHEWEARFGHTEGGK